MAERHHGSLVDTTLRFLGAAETVTGSRHLLRTPQGAYLLEAGLFQGDDALEQRDWTPFPVEPASLRAIVLTHAHIDHSGYLPRLVREGFDGPIYATEGTIRLLGLLLPDAGRLQEEQAAYANKRGYARHLPAKPLYTEKDAEATLRLLRSIPWGKPARLGPDVEVLARPAGHLLGSAILEIEHPAGKLALSGDLGRYAQDVMRDPEPIRAADVLLLECTYGNRLHAGRELDDVLEDALAYVSRTGGVLVIPSFAVGRAQLVMHRLRSLLAEGRIPHLPLFVDSPMATDATDIYCGTPEDPNLRLALDAGPACPLRYPGARFVQGREESISLNTRKGPFIVLSANGMCTGGRILHHLKFRLPDPRNAVLFVGYQARGTRGRALRDGAAYTRIHGEPIQVRARVFDAEGMSGHADHDELMRWARGFERPPRKTWLVHGEPDASAALQASLRHELGWDVGIATLDTEVSLA